MKSGFARVVLGKTAAGALALGMAFLCGSGAVSQTAADAKAETNKKGGDPKMKKEQRSGEWTPELTEKEWSTLMAIARDTLEWCAAGRKGKFTFDKYEITEKLKEPFATFVTLKIDHNLRGCIGTLTAVSPLFRSVHENAISAALRDPRFEPVAPHETEKIKISVSILSPMRDIPSYADFIVGRHGITLEKGGARAVFLPEVAVEQNWTREDTLSYLSRKAGLAPDAWRSGARFKVFESVVMSE